MPRDGHRVQRVDGDLDQALGLVLVHGELTGRTDVRELGERHLHVLAANAGDLVEDRLLINLARPTTLGLHRGLPGRARLRFLVVAGYPHAGGLLNVALSTQEVGNRTLTRVVLSRTVAGGIANDGCASVRRAFDLGEVRSQSAGTRAIHADKHPVATVVRTHVGVRTPALRV